VVCGIPAPASLYTCFLEHYSGQQRLVPTYQHDRLYAYDSKLFKDEAQRLGRNHFQQCLDIGSVNSSSPHYSPFLDYPGKAYDPYLVTRPYFF